MGIDPTYDIDAVILRAHRDPPVAQLAGGDEQRSERLVERATTDVGDACHRELESVQLARRFMASREAVSGTVE